ncbi:hypothetical protein D7B24_009501 [Verticillium nonalfalfae]|uniref:Alpha-galactosidase n=1 Tax=Verticillium nonalfalfae TaxID=1051616 RepID=A0A3M9Y5D2_9PEZI|nr:uncharacterized protein D7B24_009501 [Verticillium nonalfalfae]RNJ54678.1 hypothetical protein D7B24_009501 [Verticillium nonalfalfae]
MVKHWLGRSAPAAAPSLGLTEWQSSRNESKVAGIVVEGKSFALHTEHSSYRFHVDEETGDLFSDHFGGPAIETVETEAPLVNGWNSMQDRVQREYPDLGRGDFRVPAIQVHQADGSTVSDLRYQSHKVVPGKPELEGLPSTFGTDEEVSTLIITLHDSINSIAVDLSYSVFIKHDAVVRSTKITNNGQGAITIDKAASLSIDFPYEEMEMIQLRGDWFREAVRTRRKIEYGQQGFGSRTGYSSHLHNPFLALVAPDTTESHGDAWGFSLVYSGSFSAEVEKGSQGMTRAMLGFNPSQLSWPLAPGESLTTPEVVAAYSSAGVGGVSRIFHRLYRTNLIKSKFATKTRPVKLNSWEGLYFDFDQDTIYKLASDAADLGAKLFVLDDGWFGNEHPRINDAAGLGDWQTNMQRFPDTLPTLVKRITDLKVADSPDKLQFGIWVEPEMVNPSSTLYQEHPEWVLHAGDYPRTTQRNQLVLNAALPEVQQFIIDTLSELLSSAPITYVKWDSNRGIHEGATPSAHHTNILGMYHVYDVLMKRFPDVLWEGCASGGGRFDPGMLQYFPQIWTSDNTDALDRISIQFGTSLVYPASAMGAHVSAVPNEITNRITPIKFRAHVAMMGGSFGLELNPPKISTEDRAQIPGLLALSEKVSPIVINGDMWRLNLPEESNWPAALFISENGAEAVLFYFQVRAQFNHASPWIRLQGLEPSARYTIDGAKTYTGATLMSKGLQYVFSGDYDSRVVFITRV